MSGTNMTTHYGLTIFEDEQTDLTFKEFRTMLAGNGATEDEYSNMQKIDDIINQLAEKIDGHFESTENYIEEQIANYDDEIGKIIDESPDGYVVIGNNPDGNLPIQFNDGNSVSTLENGNFSVEKVTTYETVYGDYVQRYNPANKHLQILYRPVGGED